MFSQKIIDSDAFLDMPLSTQSLYFHLAMRADDDGFINNPKKIQRMIGASDDDFKVLIAKNFVIPFDSGIVVIKHWRIHNYIQSDRYKPTSYTEERAQLELKENKAYTLKAAVDTPCIQSGYKVDTQISVDKNRLEKSRLEDKRKRFTPPTLEEVQAYCKERKNNVDAKKFFDYYQEGEWHDSQGKPVRNWKQKLLRWEKADTQKQTQKKKPMDERELHEEDYEHGYYSDIMNRPRDEQ